MKNTFLWTIVIVIVVIALIGAVIYIGAYSNMGTPSQSTGGTSGSSTGTSVTGNPSTTPTSTANNPSTTSNNPPQTQTSSPKTYTIDIKNFAFSTKTLTIKKGDTVIWNNQDSVSHSVTSDSGNELNSASLSQGNSYSHTFDSTGTFSYHCGIHPTMKATIIVQ